jgi:serine/threonine-protein kinase
MNRLGTYEVLFELAAGGMGTVELGVARGVAGVERLVAIKRIRQHLLTSDEAESRFLDEARIISQLHHANVVGLHHAGEDERGIYLVLDYVEGETLGGLIDLVALERDRVPTPILLRIILDALNGLNAAHEAKSASGEPLRILHRDVSKQNLIVGSDGVTRLSDFGISKSSLHSTITNQNYIAGKLIYMPPEYLQRQPVDRRMDIYAMGVTFWVALAGREPWLETSEAQIINQILNQGMPTLSSIGVTVPTEIETIVARATQPVASDRFPTARHMIDALQDYGRRSGAIASQMEVAEYVERVAAPLLAERRKAVADRLLARGTPMLSTLPPPPTSQNPAETGAASAADVARIGSARWRYAWVAVAMAAVGAGVALLGGSRASKTPVLAPSVYAPAAAACVVVSAPIAPSASAAPPTPEKPMSAPSASQSVAASPRAETPPGDARRGAAPAPRPKRPSSEGLTGPNAPAVPTGISTANPYR